MREGGMSKMRRDSVGSRLGTETPSKNGGLTMDGYVSLPPLIRDKIMKHKKKPAELFRTDLISAMKLPDTDHLDPEEYWPIVDNWKTEYDKGVQVPVNPDSMPDLEFREINDPVEHTFIMPKKLINITKDSTFSSDLHEWFDIESNVKKMQQMPTYNMDAVDKQWLTLLNEERVLCGLSALTDEQFERVIDDLETRCYNNMQANQLGIEYNEDTCCDVCGSPESEDGNEMVFCDNCDICVHQACYGIVKVPSGSWMCTPCSRGYSSKPPCVLCPVSGGALKPDSDYDLWAHVSCALWVPEVTIGTPELMQPLQNLHKIPAWRTRLICSVCSKDSSRIFEDNDVIKCDATSSKMRRKSEADTEDLYKWGACIQCSFEGCDVAYHVTCAQKADIHMKACIVEGSVHDGLELKSYCSLHNTTEESSRKKYKKEIELGAIKKTHDEHHEEEEARRQACFYDFVDPKDTAANMRSRVDPLAVDFIFNYWKLKRGQCNGKPLIQAKHEESLQRPVHIDDELSSTIRAFVHLRQDLERVRNLTYLLQRREKQRKLWIKAREDVTMLQLKAATQFPQNARVILTANRLDDVYDRVYSSGQEFGFPAASVVQSLQRLVAKTKDKLDADNPYAKTYLTTTVQRASSRASLTSPTVPSDAENSSPTCAVSPEGNASPSNGEVLPTQRRTNSVSSDVISDNFIDIKAGSKRTRQVSESSTGTRHGATSPYSGHYTRYERIGRRRGGPFKRSMLPNLHDDNQSPLSKNSVKHHRVASQCHSSTGVLKIRSDSEASLHIDDEISFKNFDKDLIFTVNAHLRMKSHPQTLQRPQERKKSRKEKRRSKRRSGGRRAERKFKETCILASNMSDDISENEEESIEEPIILRKSPRLTSAAVDMEESNSSIEIVTTSCLAKHRPDLPSINEQSVATSTVANDSSTSTSSSTESCSTSALPLSSQILRLPKELRILLGEEETSQESTMDFDAPRILRSVEKERQRRMELEIAASSENDTSKTENQTRRSSLRRRANVDEERPVDEVITVNVIDSPQSLRHIAEKVDLKHCQVKVNRLSPSQLSYLTR